jgi:GT2 family glycosyltransferase
MSLSVIIPSARASNIIQCVQALLANEPSLSASKILVVDDGARTRKTRHLPVTWIDGKKPFIFAKNANLGLIAAGRDDVILMNDDAQLVTPNGLTRMALGARRQANVGICSAGIRGWVCNPQQQAAKGDAFRVEPYRLAFVCVWIARRLIRRIGILDERFTAYGYEDFDFCRRALTAGFGLATCDGCIVEHGRIPSTFGALPDYGSQLSRARDIYHEKWGGPR